MPILAFVVAETALLSAFAGSLRDTEVKRNQVLGTFLKQTCGRFRAQRDPEAKLLR
jgi:hypothetical protein